MSALSRLILALLLPVLTGFAANAQSQLNGKADNILGEYTSSHSGEVFKARITKESDGTYKAQVFWVEHDRDEYGRKILDSKNPDKSLRKVPCDRIVLFSGLRYDASRKQWDGTKVYDPTRGIRAKMVAFFDSSGRLCVRGTLFGISETIRWQRL